MGPGHGPHQPHLLRGPAPSPPKGCLTRDQLDVRCTYAKGIEMRFMSQDVPGRFIKPIVFYSDHGTTFIGTAGWIS